ncbi:hypothetical protein P879_06706 [Paragonimus westermani]|uniref:Uncharacterized protein n=1 Tax=Paragonimus westermani TaxID=34504 RepID=A0A8T0DM14_9TREM|nr:hypothetical protein P879_06706 [Paragonimus westermani]
MFPRISSLLAISLPSEATCLTWLLGHCNLRGQC